MMAYLLDTDICSVHLRGVSNISSRFLQHIGQLNISVLALGELLSWTLRAKSPPKYQRVLLIYDSNGFGVMAYRGTETQLQEVLQRYDSPAESLIEALGHIHPSIRASASYAFDQHNGVLWYYNIYQWLYPS